MHRVLLAIPILILGCSKEEPIRVYTAPKPDEVRYRILGGIFPADEPAWFFKLAGRADDIDAVQPDVEKFLASVRLPNGPQNLPVWDVPAGWKSAGRTQFAAETFAINDRLTLSVTPATGGLEPNVARWAGQLGLTWNPADKDKYLKPLGTPPKGWLVDLSGPNNPTARPRM